jgi:hypothetical protein
VDTRIVPPGRTRDDDLMGRDIPVVDEVFPAESPLDSLDLGSKRVRGSADVVSGKRRAVWIWVAHSECDGTCESIKSG